MTCANCHRSIAVKNYCFICRRCTRCKCQCVICHSCSQAAGKVIQHPVTACANCARCKKSCECKNRGAADNHFEPTRLNPNFGGVHLVNPCNRAVTVEVELTHYRNLLDKTFNGFTYNVVRDSSVNVSQTEMVLSPLQGDSVVAGLTELAIAMHEQQVRFDSSCGYHVHIDTRDLGWWQIRNLILIWERFSKEVGSPYLYPDRTNNRNCLPIWEHPYWGRTLSTLQNPPNTTELKQKLISLCFGDNAHINFDANCKDFLRRLKHSKYGVGNHDPHNIRYYDLNIFSYLYRGTVEFRVMHMTYDPAEFVAWPLVCLGLVQLACSKGEKWLQGTPGLGIVEALPRIAREYVKSKLPQGGQN